MTSKRKLRAEIERLHGEAGSEWLRGFKAACGRTIDPAPWAAHLARVTDAAREQGRREGWAAAWAAGARADEDAYRRGWEDAVADATLAAGDDAVSLPIRTEHTTGRVDPDSTRVWLVGPDGRELDFVPPSWPLGPDPQPDTTPEDAEPSAGEVNRFSGDPCRTFIFKGISAGPHVLNSIDPGFARVLVGFSTCGFACRCATIPSAWVPGSVAR